MHEIVAGFAAYRASRLVNTDTIFDEPRMKIRAWLATHDHPKLLEGFNCGYCLSVWFALAFTARRHGWLRATLAASGVAATCWTLERIAEGVEE